MKTLINILGQKMKQNKFFCIAIIGLFIWITETAYFGFNRTPVNGIEATLDALSTILIIWGIIGDIASGVSIHKHDNSTYEGDRTIIEKGAYYFDRSAMEHLREQGEKESDREKHIKAGKAAAKGRKRDSKGRFLPKVEKGYHSVMTSSLKNGKTINRGEFVCNGKRDVKIIGIKCEDRSNFNQLQKIKVLMDDRVDWITEDEFIACYK